MSCPTCDHTMQGLAGRWFWCPRCGTVLNAQNREFSTRTTHGAIVVRSWLRDGENVTPAFFHRMLAEQFQTPDEREQ